jgi:hypothetical protein
LNPCCLGAAGGEQADDIALFVDRRPPELPPAVLVFVWKIGAPSTEVFLAEIAPSLVVGSSADF